jgi:hypothetical protein
VYFIIIEENRYKIKVFVLSGTHGLFDGRGGGKWGKKLNGKG